MGPDVIRIMLVDDHAILRAGLRSLLDSQSDMTVVEEAVDADGAVDGVSRTRPDVVLLDISMPGESGIHAIGRIREASPATQILVLTMHDDQAYLRSVLAAGGAGYLVKRAADTDLLAAIRTVAQGRSYIDVALSDGALQGVLERWVHGASNRPEPTVLSDRERQVLELVALGYTHREVAEQLGVSVKTVETYRARLSEKLGLRSRAELVRYALDVGFLDPKRGV